MCAIVCVSVCCMSSCSCVFVGFHVYVLVCVCVCWCLCHCVTLFVSSLGVIVWVSLCMSLRVTSRAWGSIYLSHIGSKPCRNAVKKYALLKYLHIYLHFYLHLYLLFRFLTITQFWPKNKNFNISFLIFPSRF